MCGMCPKKCVPNVISEGRFSGMVVGSLHWYRTSWIPFNAADGEGGIEGGRGGGRGIEGDISNSS